MTYKVTYLSNMRGSFILHSNRSCEHRRRPIACARTHSRGRGASSGAIARVSRKVEGTDSTLVYFHIISYNIVTSYYFYIYGVGPSHFIVLKSDPLDGRWNSTHPQDEDPGIRYWAIEAHLHSTFLKDAESIDLPSILLCRDTLVILVSHLSRLQLRSLKPF